MTPDQLRGAARNLAYGLGIPFYIRDDRIYQNGPGLAFLPIRTSSTRARCIWLSRLLTLPVAWVGSAAGGTTIAERVAFGRVPDKIGRQKGRADQSKAGKRDNQMHRARVLEVRIHLPPQKSLQTISSSAAEPTTADGRR